MFMLTCTLFTSGCHFEYQSSVLCPASGQRLQPIISTESSTWHLACFAIDFAADVSPNLDAAAAELP